MFGGNYEKRQVNQYILNHFLNFIFKISKVVGCSLKRQSSLGFDFQSGACGTYQLQYKEKILLCFGYDPYKDTMIRKGYVLKDTTYNISYKSCYW